MKASDVIISKTVYLKRNLENYNFAMSLSDKKALEIYMCIKHELERVHEILGDKFKFEILALSSMNYLDLKKFEARGIIPARIKSNIGRGIAICDECFVLINFDDHITIGKKLDGKSLEIEKELRSVYELENALQQNLAFAFDEDFGFLSSCSDYFGTGLVIQFLSTFYFMINGEAYIKKLHSIFKDFFTLRMTEKTSKDSSSSQFVFTVLSDHSHYKNTESQVEKMRSILGEAIEAECADRNIFIQNSYDEAYDFVLRAFLLAKNSLLAPEYNMLDLLATLRFGIVTKLIENMSLSRIDKLFVELRSPFIVEKILNESRISMQDVSIKMIDKMRASMLRKEFKNVTMKEYTNGTKFF